MAEVKTLTTNDLDPKAIQRMLLESGGKPVRVNTNMGSIYYGHKEDLDENFIENEFENNPNGGSIEFSAVNKDGQLDGSSKTYVAYFEGKDGWNHSTGKFEHSFGKAQYRFSVQHDFKNGTLIHQNLKKFKQNQMDTEGNTELSYHPNGAKKIEKIDHFDPLDRSRPTSSTTNQYDTGGLKHGVTKETMDTGSKEKLYSHGVDTGLKITSGQTGYGGLHIEHEDPKIQEKLDRTWKEEQFKENNALYEILGYMGLYKNKAHMDIEQKEQVMFENVIKKVMPEHLDAAKQRREVIDQPTIVYKLSSMPAPNA